LVKTPEYKKAVQETFAQFDANGNGRINKGEL
jgi:Ca2+-binding EF-hand superfamily protein